MEALKAQLAAQQDQMKAQQKAIVELARAKKEAEVRLLPPPALLIYPAALHCPGCLSTCCRPPAQAPRLTPRGSPPTLPHPTRDRVSQQRPLSSSCKGT